MAFGAAPALCAQRLPPGVRHAAHRRHHGLTRVGAGLEKGVYFSSPPHSTGRYPQLSPRQVAARAEPARHGLELQYTARISNGSDGWRLCAPYAKSAGNTVNPLCFPASHNWRSNVASVTDSSNPSCHWITHQEPLLSCAIP